ncbi:MAG: hypothetical protein H8E98_07185 [Bacteroidetes bacterium]|nr:hypothetical protein [Bacteroidota bacterium]
MKKLFALLLIAGMTAFVACGPSAEEIAAKEKLQQELDSMKEKVRLDSIAEVEAAEIAAKLADSIAQQELIDSIQNLADAANRKAAAAKKEAKTLKDKAAQQRDPKVKRKVAPAAGQGKG